MERWKNVLLKAALCSNEVSNPSAGVLEGLVLALSNCPKGTGDYSCLYSYFAELIFSQECHSGSVHVRGDPVTSHRYESPLFDSHSKLKLRPELLKKNSLNILLKVFSRNYSNICTLESSHTGQHIHVTPIFCLQTLSLQNVLFMTLLVLQQKQQSQTYETNMK